ncbi:MAG TPA: PaaI family thioesterase [Spirochaetota bacterium]|nr:PaaI family thioesterase [Spirochaetota bacterium]HPC43200.1 PaaI family thioesterase [Spirochaetota bacterium]HPL19052.1 PaaI family thioesterase [Spirochaetota bacterium]HQF10429.1 PaaI family thioesterase [Spirochaetota bacterium]HQH99328.1 PaaI family thioesterase [Spirochaetota bacterium]
METALETITLENGFTFNYAAVTGGTYIEYNGIRLTEIGKGLVRGEVVIKPELLNPNKILHGGVFGTLADTVAIFGCIYMYEVAAVTTVNLTVSYLKAAKSGTISAAARMLSQGKSISHWQVDMTDDEGRLLAVASVSYSIKR